MTTPGLFSDPEPVPHARFSELRIEGFKGFRDATLRMGGLTAIVGTNAAGKSNVRDAFRFLHGIGRGYTLAEIIGEKWIEGGVPVWRGIRGGTREAAYRGGERFAIETAMLVRDASHERTARYRIVVELQRDAPPRFAEERLVLEGRGQYVFDSHPDANPPPQVDPSHLAIRLRKGHQKGL